MKRCFWVILFEVVLFLNVNNQILAQTCSGSVSGTNASCGAPDLWGFSTCEYAATVENCSYSPSLDLCGANVPMEDCRTRWECHTVYGDTVCDYDCNGSDGNSSYETCGPADPDPTPPGQTPPPGTPPPASNATFRFQYDLDHDGVIDPICGAMGAQDRWIQRNVAPICSGCLYQVETGYAAGAVTHQNICTLGVPESRVALSINPQVVTITIPAGRYVTKASGGCSIVDGDPLKYSCPFGAVQTLLINNVSSACGLSVTGPATLRVGQAGNLSVTRVGTGTITGIWVDSSTPNPDGAVSYDGTPVAWDGITPSPYTGLTITGSVVGGATVTVKGVNSATGIQCSASYNLTVTPALEPWWVTFGADITAGEIIYSDVPSIGWYFFNYTSSVASGIPIYHSDLDYGSGTLSDTNRRADTLTYNLNPTYTALYTKADKTATFTTIAPGTHVLADISGSTPDTKGWEWYKVEGNLTLDTAAFTFASRKVVVFVNGDLVVNRNIQCVDGVGMPVFVVAGNITFNSSVAAPTTLFEGAYYAGGDITFNSNGAQTDPLVTVRAILVAGGSVINNRDRGVSNNSYAILHSRTPDLLFLLPSFMTSKKSLWREVAP